MQHVVSHASLFKTMTWVKGWLVMLINFVLGNIILPLFSTLRTWMESTKHTIQTTSLPLAQLSNSLCSWGIYLFYIKLFLSFTLFRISKLFCELFVWLVILLDFTQFAHINGLYIASHELLVIRLPMDENCAWGILGM